ncbi:transcriptional regulator, TetR family [Agromyces sp. CF514]|uniref:TetR/AcrR family transcriptional regulator n=1 Tax=Agromyces sp. CF514 TaxID=1881031 RepID=UPI0008E1E65D|nr:TetR/AcrR family transcriptional regulator [Agromyces sp. CF514]SFR67953.1 transcriptional regulator, TetR family [Agromyces sp. CF514]
MKPGPRRSISQADIVDAAFEIFEEKGGDAVSIRGVAARLGLTPTAMYTYFTSKNALQRAMVEQVFSKLDLAAASDPSAPWRVRVQRLAADLRARFAEHPGAIVLVASGPLDGRQALSFGETLIEGFTGEGMPLADAARAAAAVRALVLGAITLDAAAAGSDTDAADAPAPLWTEATQHPLTEAAELLAQGDAFASNLDRLLDGFGIRPASPIE